MWADHHYGIQKQICSNVPGVWYGIWDHGNYSIAKLSEEVSGVDLEEIEIPAGIYAVFKSGFGGYAGVELPRLREGVFDSWLQDSGYTQIGDCEIEVYHLYLSPEKHKRRYELWIPVESRKAEDRFPGRA